MKMKRRIVLTLAVSLGLFGATSAAALAEQTTVPVSTLKPAVHLDKPELTGVGGKLILSDSPETFTAPGAFYRDRVTGEFRVFWHHQSKADHSLTVAVAVTNESEKPVQLFSKGSGTSANLYVDVAGQEALSGYLNTQGTTRFLATLAPGESYFLESPTDHSLTSSGFAQFSAFTQNGHQPAEVTVTTLNYDVKPDHPELVPIFPADKHTRGTFDHFDRIGTLKYNTSLGNAYIRIDSNPTGRWSDSLPGEYEAGWDAVDGKSVMNNGNYGVLYRLKTEIVNDAHNPRAVSLFLNPSGGYGHFALDWNHKVLESGFLSYVNAWKFTEFTLGANGGTYKSDMSLTGGSSGPQVIYFTNEER